MKKITFGFLITIMSSLVLCFSSDLPMENNRHITVNGDAIVNVKPDKITIYFGIETSNMDITDAKKGSTRIFKETISALKSLGVSEKDITSEHLSIEPRYQDYYEKRNFLGYFVRNGFSVITTSPDQVDSIIAAAMKSGITHIHDVKYETTELKKYREQAREMALKAAKEKALKMAAVLGQSIGEPVSISEGYGGYGWWYNSIGWEGRGGGIMSQNISQSAPNRSGESDSLALGLISVQGNASVTFELKK